MGLGALNFSIIDTPIEPGPRNFAADVPLGHNFTAVCDLDDHVQPCTDDNEIAIGSRRNVMNVIEAGQRNVSDLSEFRQLEDQNFSGRTRIKRVANDGPTVEIYGRFRVCPCFRGSHVLYTGPNLPRHSVDLQDYSRLVPGPVGPIMREGEFLFPSTQDVKFSHDL